MLNEHIKNQIWQGAIKVVADLLLNRAFPILIEEMNVELPRTLRLVEEYSTGHFSNILKNYSGKKVNGSFTLNDLMTHLNSLKHINSKTNVEQLIIAIRYEWERLEDIFKNSKSVASDLQENIKNSLHEVLHILDLMNLVKVKSTKIGKNIYQIGVLANMNSGKSTIINALLGQNLLPSSQYFRTGRLTYINNSQESTVTAKIAVNDNSLFVTFKEQSLLENYLTKYGKLPWFHKAEVYGNTEPMRINGQILPQSNVPFVSEIDNRSVFDCQAKIYIAAGKEISIDNLSQLELNCFVNNKYVQDIAINVPINFLSGGSYTSNVQIVDTPGRNPQGDSESTKNHKLIVDTFMPLADLILYVIDLDVDTIDSADEDEYLRKLIEERKKVDTLFYQNIIFVLNKKDKAENNYGEEAVAEQILKIKAKIRSYGIKAADEQFVAISAERGLLAKRYKQEPQDAQVQEDLLKHYFPNRQWKNKIGDNEALQEAYKFVSENSGLEKLEEFIKSKIPQNYWQKLKSDGTQVLASFLTYLSNKIEAHKKMAGKTSAELNAEKDKLNKLVDELKKNKEPELKKMIGDALSTLNSKATSFFTEQEQKLVHKIDEVANEYKNFWGVEMSSQSAAIEIGHKFLNKLNDSIDTLNANFKSQFTKELIYLHKKEYDLICKAAEGFIGNQRILTPSNLYLPNLGNFKLSFQHGGTHTYSRFLFWTYNHKYHYYLERSQTVETCKKEILSNLNTVKKFVLSGLRDDKNNQERNIIGGLESYISLRQNEIAKILENIKSHNANSEQEQKRFKKHENELHSIKEELAEIERKTEDYELDSQKPI